jgi:hypothetical protein
MQSEISLATRALRKTYLITYTRANEEIFCTGESFGKSVCEAFSQGSSKVKVLIRRVAKKIIVMVIVLHG